ncbi:site-specific integrase [Micromonospora sp. DT68]|uniref:site-specific integrase n=1 Tax=Micromonospora sp. DT68 TaxID=3416522 RepID=UPI003CF289A3
MNEMAARGSAQHVDSSDPNEQLSESARRRIRESVPASTRRAYAGDWSRFTQWCIDKQRFHLPATPATLAEYISQLADEGKASSTIERAMAAITVAHASADFPPPNTRPARAVLRRHRAELAEAGPVTNDLAGTGAKGPRG